MKLRRRTFLYLAAGAASLSAARAQAYPARPVRVVVGFPGGSASDTTARLIGQALSERFGQQFLIENRTGAASNIAAEAVVRAPPDGHTLLLLTSVNAINAMLYDNLGFDLIHDMLHSSCAFKAAGHSTSVSASGVNPLPEQRSSESPAIPSPTSAAKVS
jgi:tripartite-type tricarboxylate transporter receptor subunit TctC